MFAWKNGPIHVCQEEWTNPCLHIWKNGLTHVCMKEWTNPCLQERMDQPMFAWKEWTNGPTHVCKEEWTNPCLPGRMDQSMFARKNGQERMDQPMFAWKDGPYGPIHVPGRMIWWSVSCIPLMCRSCDQFLALLHWCADHVLHRDKKLIFA